MLEKLNRLLKNKAIDTFTYDTYLLFEFDPKGKLYLSNMVTDSFRESARAFTGAAFAWQDGRRSVWRDIQNTILCIHQLPEKKDGSTE